MFDASRPETMGVLDGWLQELNQHNSGKQCWYRSFSFTVVTLLLACNKIDKNAGVDKNSIENYARSIHARVFYTSAKTGEGIDALFTEMATSIINRKRNDFLLNAPPSSSNPTTIATQAPEEEKKKCCCYLGLFQTLDCTGGIEMVKYS